MPSKANTAETDAPVKKVRKKTGKKAPAKKTAPAKTAPAKSAPAKSAPAKSVPAKTAPAKGDGGSPPPSQAASSSSAAPASTKSGGSGGANGSGDSGSSGGGEQQKQQQASSGSEQRQQQQHGSSGGGGGQKQPQSGHDNRQKGGGGGGGGDNRHGGDNRQGRRNKKKKRKRNQQGAGGPHGPTGIPASVLPSEEDLDREAAELEELIASAEYDRVAEEGMHLGELERMPLAELHELADEMEIENAAKLARPDLVFQLLRRGAEEDGIVFGEGSLFVAPEGFGFLRSKESSYVASPSDVYVSPSQIRRNGLRPGMEVAGAIRSPKENERFFALLRIDSINGHDPAEAKTLPIFEDLTPLHPEERFVLETEPDVIETRVIDLVAPIGRGQRGLIVAPPRTGKTVILQKITRAISKNYPEVKIIVLLIDERPEEVTDFRRNTAADVEVVASTFDEQSGRHVQVAEMVMEKARRWVEFGEHVVILLDSITRLARAYNAAQPHSGKIMTGGIDSNALTRPKKFFGSARATEDGGSLTILGTALVDTGSKADEVIFEEFKGTGNSELHLDRKLVEKRVWPAIDVAASGTRREELLMDPKELELTYRLRKVLSDMNVVEAMELMRSRLAKTKSNAEFLMTMNLG